MDSVSLKINLLIGFTLLLSVNSVFSQMVSKRGTVVSANDSVPVSYAAITIKGKPVGTITNLEGNFTLTVDGAPDDTICIAHLNFETELIPWTILKPEGGVISLIGKVYTIGEVSVQAESVVDILKNSIKRSVQAIAFPMRLETYYREFVQQNKKYTRFSDGLLDYDLLGNVEKVKSKVRVIQSRAKEIKEETTKGIDWDLTSILDVGDALNPFFLSTLKQIVESSNLYDFHMVSRSNNNNDTQTEISFTPKPGHEEPLLIGVVLLDSNTKYILSFVYNMEQDSLKPGKEMNFIFVKARILQYSSIVLFKLEGTNYQPWYTSKQVGVKFWNNKKIDISTSFLSDLLVNKAVHGPFEPIPGKEAYKKKALYSLGDNYQTTYWKDQNMIRLTTAEEKIIDQLK